ncbi:GNAT family N-acetyltransferase [Streptomyces sp. PmtG]
MKWNDERLLACEVDACYGLVPDSGSPPAVRDPTVLAVWAWSPAARLLAYGPDAPRREPHDIDGQPYEPGRRPEALDRLAASLGGGAASVEGGPCWVFPPEPTAPEPAAGLPLLVSGAEGRRAARHLLRPANWQPGEWGELIDGRLGEWAMAVHGREPVSVCHTPAATGTAAEAGIWTRPDFRGRGLAPACVAAWSHREGQVRDVLFYSTTADNHASRAVARRLGLRPLGWIWTVR